MKYISVFLDFNWLAGNDELQEAKDENSNAVLGKKKNNNFITKYI